MFTGIVEALGQVSGTQDIGGDLRLWVRAPTLDWSAVALGDSIATNGVCLTVVELRSDGFSADVSRESLGLTTIAQWRVGTPVNLEQALTPNSRLGGHMVSGHIDGVGTVVARTGDARSQRFTLEAPAALARYIAHKGSIAVDGVSLTVNRVDGARFELNIVPHTLQHTVMDTYQVGTQVNLEVDLIARYLERLVMGEKAAHSANSAITAEFLAQNGYHR